MISKSVLFPPYYIPSVHPRVCRCVGVVREKYNIMFIYSFGGVMCTLLLILQSMVCSPLLVRYHVTEMTAIYYYNIRILLWATWVNFTEKQLRQNCSNQPGTESPEATSLCYQLYLIFIVPPTPAWNHIHQSTLYVFPTFHTYLQCVCFLLSTGGLCTRQIFHWVCIPGPLNIKHRVCQKKKKILNRKKQPPPPPPPPPHKHTQIVTTDAISGPLFRQAFVHGILFFP